MGFDWHDVQEDDSFTPEADPVLHGMLHRQAGAAILQDISLNTYWANVAGKTVLKHPGVAHMYKKELMENMEGLLQTKMSYRELEEFLVMVGYEAKDIRCAFHECTGLDPVKLDYMRSEDVKNTPSNIPWYNLGWGLAKKGEKSFFVMPYANNLFTVFCQEDDMTRTEVASFLRHDEALAYLKPLVKNIHRYDMPAIEQAEDALSTHVKEPEKKVYRVMANLFYDLANRNELDIDKAKLMVRDAVLGGSLTEEEGEMLIKVHAAETDSGDVMPNPQHTENTPDQGQGQELLEAQKSKRVLDEMEKKTPNDYFQAALPERMDEEASEHVKGVLGYISNRESDMGEFKAKLYSLEYKLQEETKTLVEVDPETGRLSGPPLATISVVLELQDTTLPDERSRKFALAVFFVNSDGDITTSDSIKGEDDIIYGFTEEGLRQYFAKERVSKAAQ